MEKRARRWWLGFTAALLLLLPIDLFTTLLTVSRHGTAIEANPIMRWLLEQGIVEVTLVHLAVTGVVVYLFHLTVAAVQQASVSSKLSLERGVNAWLGIMLAGGLVVVVNNVLAFL